MYRPSTLPAAATLDDVQRFLEEELTAIAREFGETDLLRLVPRHRPPEKLRPGMIVEADGVNWNPGLGAGLYIYRGGVWVKIA